MEQEILMPPELMEWGPAHLRDDEVQPVDAAVEPVDRPDDN